MVILNVGLMQQSFGAGEGKKKEKWLVCTHRLEFFYLFMFF